MNIGETLSLYQQMRTTLVNWVDLAEPQWNLLALNFQIKTVQKQEYILLP